MPAPTDPVFLPGLPDFAPQQPSFQEVFPLTPPLDDFNRASLGSNWITPSGGAPQTMGITSNRMQANGAFGQAAWAGPFDRDCEFYFDVTTASIAGNHIYLLIRPAHTGANADHYEVQVIMSTGVWTMFRMDKGVATQLGTTLLQPVKAGDGIGVRMYGDKLEAWYRPGATGAWVKLGQRTDNTYVYGGSIQIGSDDATFNLDNFGGGNLVPVTCTPQPISALTNPLSLSLGLLPRTFQVPYFPPAAGVTFPQEMDADAVVVTASIVKQINKLVSGTTVVVTATLLKQVNKILSATAVGVTASIAKQVNKFLTATTVVVTASLLALKVILKTLTATTVVVTASIQKQVNKALSATTVLVTASMRRQVNKILTATTVVVTATLQALKVILKALTATTVVVTASMVRQVSKPLVATTVAVTASIQKQVSKKLTATSVAVTATLQALKVILKAMTATTVVVTATMVRQTQLHLSATVALSASIVKRISKTLTATAVSLSASLGASFVGALIGPLAASLTVQDVVSNALGISDLLTIAVAIGNLPGSSVDIADASAAVTAQDLPGADVLIKDITP